MIAFDLRRGRFDDAIPAAPELSADDGPRELTRGRPWGASGASSGGIGAAVLVEVPR